MVPENRIEATGRIAAILRQRNSPLAELMRDHPDVRELPRHVREKIVDELGEEFSAKGLKGNGEPNAYGIEMEALTDACGLAWDETKDQPADCKNDDPHAQR